jgi:hypothetical protein
MRKYKHRDSEGITQGHIALSGKVPSHTVIFVNPNRREKLFSFLFFERDVDLGSS